MKKLINKTIEKIRKDNKLSRRELAELSGFKERTILSYERGENQISSEYLKFICLYFGFCSDLSTELNKIIRVILMYQEIYNYSDETMARLLNMPTKKYKADFNLLPDSENQSMTKHYTAHEIIDLLFYTKITPNSIKGDDFWLFTRDYTDKITLEFQSGVLSNKKWDIYYTRIQEIKNNTIDITPEYYASIIKKRNTPEKITPLNTTSDIPPKHRELLELLKFAPDSFTDEIIKKLKEIKKLQEF
jgi:DNA-binding helix-turn-helix protein|nr:helix-turn-helix transcriptional regulator [uncultured Campylobacter sp.]